MHSWNRFTLFDYLDFPHYTSLFMYILSHYHHTYDCRWRRNKVSVKLKFIPTRSFSQSAEEKPQKPYPLARSSLLPFRRCSVVKINPPDPHHTSQIRSNCLSSKVCSQSFSAETREHVLQTFLAGIHLSSASCFSCVWFHAVYRNHRGELTPGGSDQRRSPTIHLGITIFRTLVTNLDSRNPGWKVR